MRDFRILFTGLCLAFSLTSYAQKIETRGGFLSDSLKIGEQTAFYLSARYPSQFTVLFPDSTYTFAPFEYERKEYYTTRTTGGQSVDSAVYYLTTFEIDPILTLSLPAFVVNTRDCTVVQSNLDSIKVIQLVPHPPDSVSAEKLPLKETLAYQNVFFAFNYPLYAIIGGIVIVLLVVGLLVFGKRIRQYFRIKRMLKNHSKFQETYAASLRQLQSISSVPLVESAVVIWKKYMEQLEAKPYTKLTTLELVRIERDEALGKNLRSIDGALYGHNTAALESLENLKGFADQRFQKKLEDVKHGK